MTESTDKAASTAADEAAINKDLLLNHEYDGIREYDNPMPKWWKWIFWGSFYFAVAYFLHYHITGNGESVAATYQADLTAAREKEAMAVMGTELSEESLAKLKANDAMMADAAMLFVQRCAQCHKQKGEGLIGPNLTDDSWIHGKPTLMNIYEIISEGIQTKGMPPWKRQLRPIEISKLAAFVGSLINTNVPGKAPEGTKIAVLMAGDGTAKVEGAAPDGQPETAPGDKPEAAPGDKPEAAPGDPSRPATEPAPAAPEEPAAPAPAPETPAPKTGEAAAEGTKDVPTGATAEE